MIIVERRVEVQVISPDALRSYMTFRGMSIRALAEKAGCSHSTVGFLVKGTRKTCKVATATAIAKALGCPVESFFAAKVSTVTREVGHRGEKAA